MPAHCTYSGDYLKIRLTDHGTLARLTVTWPPDANQAGERSFELDVERWLGRPPFDAAERSHCAVRLQKLLLGEAARQLEHRPWPMTDEQAACLASVIQAGPVATDSPALRIGSLAPVQAAD